MTPNQLTSASFAGYPPEARAFAAAHLALLKQLPLAVAPAFLREIIVLDWRFPAEQRAFEGQCTWLEQLTPAERAQQLAPFRNIHLPESLAAKDWVSAPQPFLEELTAYLWSSGQIDGYRRAAQQLLAAPVGADAASPSRLAIVIVGKDAVAPSPALFRRLAPYGVTLRNLQWTPETPRELQAALVEHGSAQSSLYARWYIDGGEPWPPEAPVQQLSYAALRPVRERVLQRMNRFTQSTPSGSGRGGAEEMRSMMTGLTPTESGADQASRDPRMQHFITALFAEGSGTQIYSTSFVQWAARETLRRAQPERLLVRFAPRQRQRTLNQLFDAATNVEVPDPEGSLRDADIAAYYIWLDLLRIANPDRITFLAWREGRGDAVIIAPRAAHGHSDETPLNLAGALEKYT